jgi:hypothetical protein
MVFLCYLFEKKKKKKEDKIDENLILKLCELKSLIYKIKN